MSSNSILSKIEHFVALALKVFHENQLLFGVVAIVLVIVFLLIWSFRLPKKSR